MEDTNRSPTGGPALGVLLFTALLLWVQTERQTGRQGDGLSDLKSEGSDLSFRYSTEMRLEMVSCAVA